jgi:hypothetical protein
MAVRGRLDAAIDRLAGLIEGGHLLASMGGEGLLTAAADLVERHAAELAAAGAREEGLRWALLRGWCCANWRGEELDLEDLPLHSGDCPLAAAPAPAGGLLAFLAELERPRGAKDETEAWIIDCERGVARRLRECVGLPPRGGSMSCRHRRTWVILGGRAEWCYECGAWRRLESFLRAAPEGAERASRPASAWARPTGPGGENSYDQYVAETKRYRKRMGLPREGA